MERPTKKEFNPDKRYRDVVGLEEWVSMTTERYNTIVIPRQYDPNVIPIMNDEPPLTPEEEMGLPSADIAIVASQSGVSLRQAAQTLHTHHGDIVNAIIALTTPVSNQATTESEDIYA
jgi:NACalpha-BTF3-like transcription factor